VSDRAGDAPVVKIYGERNSGTNYLAALLGLNLRATQLRGVAPRFRALSRTPRLRESARDLYFDLTYRRNLGWKHGMAPDDSRMATVGRAAEHVGFVTITKNPYAWLLSLHRRPYHARGPTPTFEAFVAAPWHARRRDGTPMQLPSPVALWNTKNESYLALARRASCVNVRYEDLVADPEAVVRGIADRLAVPLNEPFRNVVRSTKKERKDYTYYRDYYVGERWRDQLSDAAVDLVNAALDDDVMAAFSYERVERPALRPPA
jgi:hypothetical protein